MNRRDQYLLNRPEDNRYGRFSEDGSEFFVLDPHPPRPWINVLANPRFGAVVSHAGCGFTFVENSQLSVLTRWHQDLVADASGTFLYLYEPARQALWSASPAPVWAPMERFRCTHGLGYTVIEVAHHRIATRWTLLVHPEEPAELWLLEVTNHDSEARTLHLVPYLEWNCGVAPSPRREFAKLFLENGFAPEHGAVWARAHMWEVGGGEFGHWNREYPFVAAFGADRAPADAHGDKGEFFGRGGHIRAPQSLGEATWHGSFGRHGDPIAALRYPLTLEPGETQELAFVLAAGADAGDALGRVRRLAQPGEVKEALARTRAFWRQLLGQHVVATPDPFLDPVLNLWSRYQAIAGRLWARCGYYQQSGAYGFRDQLQDAQVWLTIAPERCREQVELHAAHQFADGSAYHWWHPLTEQGLPSTYADDYLWLAFVTASYLKETGDWGALERPVPFVDDPNPHPLLEHIRRAFARAQARLSPRGLPLIGGGDWNDGLSACGLKGRGESVWMAHFLALLAGEWAVIAREIGLTAWAEELAQLRERMVTAVNEHGWDGAWYWRATTDDGALVGSRTCREGRIYLNAQTWAILAETADPERQRVCWEAVREQLLAPMGPLLLAPAYTRPVREIGYITRYAPGTRENGGVYTHAATWALAAACKIRDSEAASQILVTLTPARKDPDQYWAEPYVLPGNVDGPPSPWRGRGGWTWYTGSAAWFHRVVTEWVCGVRPTWEGLLFDPCLPQSWHHVRGKRPYRQAEVRFTIQRDRKTRGVQVTVNGRPLPRPVLPAAEARGPLEVTVTVGEQP